MSANRKITYGILGLLAAALLTAGVAEAQTAAPDASAPDAAAAPQKAKPKPKAAGPARVDVVVANNRAVALTALVASPSGSPESKKIAGPLAAGKKVVVHLAHDKACLFDIHGDYADGTSTEVVESVALCKDKKIDLVE
jgi:hypothetical protein